MQVLFFEKPWGNGVLISFYGGLVGFYGGLMGLMEFALHTKNYGKSQFLIGKSTISMSIFNSKLLVYQRVTNQ